jgi:Mlc titration factor MtfA (ptsG expression regulator)
MDILITVVTLLVLLSVVAYLIYYIIITVIEPIYIMVFNRPLYLHFYAFRKELHPLQKAFLEKYNSFYRRLPARYKGYFGHRVSKFIDTYTFAGREGLEVNDAMKLQVAATSVMLTFGMRDYLHRSVSAIILYPDIYQSGSGDYHKGEFNPAAKAVVFSWKHFNEGLDVESDNLNLGLHEFSHVIHYEARRRLMGVRGPLSIYVDTFQEIINFLNDKSSREQMIAAGYFREYAYTNEFEFVAVVLEHFFETPAEFKQKVPELYILVKKMINYRETWQ